MQLRLYRTVTKQLHLTTEYVLNEHATTLQMLELGMLIDMNHSLNRV